ncbi:MAG TPA: hypothetical protein VLU46_05440 [Thermoanaerobaculia bacterium]|nr:hypothetical protein [Thermoanaerobaculia bacterium]
MNTPACLLCSRTSDVVPLIALEYRGATLRVCTQHLPVIIHDPASLAGLLPGAEQLEPSSHRD